MLLASWDLLMCLIDFQFLMIFIFIFHCITELIVQMPNVFVVHYDMQIINISSFIKLKKKLR